ncbi:MAG: trehalase family glycosidase [Vicinamibacterales bacterium]
MAATGAWCGLTDSIANTLHWMVLLQPESGRRYVPAGRRWLFPSPDGGRDHWTIFEWDGFLNALLLSLESPDLAREMLDAVVATQYPSGNVPNWRGRFAGTPDRSQPPIGAFVVVKLLLRLDDVALVEHVLPALEAWHAWWRRRRRPSGLYAWGSDVSAVPDWVPPWERAATHRQKAAWESGQDDLPNWDDVPWDEVGQTLDMDCVDLSALVALDAECLSFLAERVGRIDQAQRYRSEHAALCARLDERLWDESRGVYADRFPDGRFSSRLAASNFLPLLAGAVPDHRLSRVLDLLTDPNQFWGRWIVPTIGRRDPAFQDQQYWRGTIWPPTNFLLYEGLRRVRADDAAATLAERSVALFLDDWRCHQVSRENFSSIDGIGGGHRHQSWGPLFSWTGLSELVDATPWDGLRVGAVSMARESSVTRLRLGGHVWDVTLGPSRTVVRCDGIVELMADAPVCLRHWQNADRGWQARLSTSRPTVVSVRGDEPRLYPAGNHDVEARQVE